jgi:hypothetical protein
MQKIQSYLYPNRLILLADLAGFTVENTIVYQRTAKIYQGVDNVLEFDIQNADQKRLDLVTSPTITNLQMHVTDQAGNALPNSPYTVTTLETKGLASVTIPSTDLVDLKPQFFKFTVTATKGSNTIPLYTDSKFGAVGSMELVASAMPLSGSNNKWEFTQFTGEINFMGNVINHTSAIPTKTYEAVPATTMNIRIDMTNFIGSVYVEATTDMNVSVESFKDAPRLATMTYTVATTTTINFNDLPIGKYNYFRVSWLNPNAWSQTGYTTNPYGEVTKVTVNP